MLGGLDKMAWQAVVCRPVPYGFLVSHHYKRIELNKNLN